MVVFGAGGLPVAAAIAAALMYAPENPGPAPTGGTPTPVVQLPQLTGGPGSRGCRPAGRRQPGPRPGAAAEPGWQAAGRQRRHGRRRRPDIHHHHRHDATDHHDHTTTTSSAPPPIDPGNGAGAPAEGQAGNEGNAPQMPVEEASNGDAEDAGAG
jgi:molecular chaperone DnaK